jgi:hypothetical protein
MHEGSKVIIVVVQVGAVKIYVAAEQWRRAQEKKERGDETQFTPKIGGNISLGLSYFVFVKFYDQMTGALSLEVP